MSAMRVEPYLSFNGDCEAAFDLYVRCLGGRLGPIMRYAGSPMGEQVPPEWDNRIMHGSVELGERILMGADAPPGSYREPQGFTLSVQIENVDEAERIFGELSDGGQVVMPSRRRSGLPASEC